MANIYLIGSLRNPRIPEIAAKLRAAGHEVFDDWFAAGPEADDYWQKYEINRGHNYKQGLAGYAAGHVYEFDKYHLDRCDIAILALPAGKSGHLELGYCVGAGKKGYILFDLDGAMPDRWDVMYRFSTGVFFKLEDLVNEISSPQSVIVNVTSPSGETGIHA